MKTKQLLKEIKGVFKPPKKKYYFGKLVHGTPYFVPKGFTIRNIHLGWKDKFSSPRYEWSPQFNISFLGLQFCIWWCSPDNDEDQYYEQILWYLYYSDKDIKKAKETWPWVYTGTNKNTWNDKYLIHG